MTNNDQASKELTPKQELLIELLLAGLNIAAAARQAGVGDKTARRWLKLPHFRSAYRRAQHDMFVTSMRELQTLVGKAIKTVDRHMDSEETSASVQLRAAQLVFEHSEATDKMSEIEELQEKVAMLEQHISV